MQFRGEKMDAAAAPPYFKEGWGRVYVPPHINQGPQYASCALSILYLGICYAYRQ